MRSTSNLHACPDCRNHFVQPFVCITCGAEKLYDETVRSQAATIDHLRRYERAWKEFVSLQTVGVAMSATSSLKLPRPVRDHYGYNTGFEEMKFYRDTAAWQEVEIERLRVALEGMCAEFRGYDLPYGSAAYLQAQEALRGKP